MSRENVSSDEGVDHIAAGSHDHPFIALITDDDHERLRERAHGACDHRWVHWTRSYSGGVALVAGWRYRIGVDVEREWASYGATWSTNDAHFRSTMMTPEERRRFPASRHSPGRRDAVSLWCSKEALAKALGTPLDMDPARLTGPAAWENGARGLWSAARLDIHALGTDAVAWLVHEAAP